MLLLWLRRQYRPANNLRLAERHRPLLMMEIRGDPLHRRQRVPVELFQSSTEIIEAWLAVWRSYQPIFWAAAQVVEYVACTESILKRIWVATEEIEDRVLCHAGSLTIRSVIQDARAETLSCGPAIVIVGKIDASPTYRPGWLNTSPLKLTTPRLASAAMQQPPRG